MDRVEQMRATIKAYCSKQGNCSKSCCLFNECRKQGYLPVLDKEYETAYKIIIKSSHDVLNAIEEKQDNQDNVNHPNHYQGPNECIDVMRAMFGKEAVKHFCMCNAFKYRFRSGQKNGEEDIKKAEWYETYLIKLQEEE
ncbi:MAG: DUF3310 domain-containing protein [bacterium]|nr:DUF3310 domain-containing protein [bacterium]